MHNMANLTPKRGIKYSGLEAPSGVLGRMSVLGPIIEEANAVIMLSEKTHNHIENLKKRFYNLKLIEKSKNNKNTILKIKKFK